MTLDEQQKKETNQIPCNPFVINRLRLVFRTGRRTEVQVGRACPYSWRPALARTPPGTARWNMRSRRDFWLFPREPCSQMLLTPSKASGSR